VLTWALWLLGLAVLAGIGLSTFHLQERPIRGAARWASAGHGLAGAAGTALVFAALWSAASDANGFSQLALYLLGAALLGGLIIGLGALRRRRASGLVVALHATLGVAGAVILLAYVSTPH
jgi:hypothetical protein